MMNVRHVVIAVLCLIFILPQVYGHPTITTFNNFDPLPQYVTTSPHDYLTTYMKRTFRDICVQQECLEPCKLSDRFLFSIGFFDQKAHHGRNYQGERVPLGDLQGDLQGHWNMLAMLYGKIPAGQTLPTLLADAKQALFHLGPDEQVPVEAEFVDPNGLIGFFSVPLKYHKSGFRFALEFEFGECSDFGIGVYGGVSSIRQTNTAFIDLTPACTTISSDDAVLSVPNNFWLEQILNDYEDASIITCSFINTVEITLMLPHKDIFEEIGQDPCNFKGTSFEDIHLAGWWRHLFRVNHCDDACYPSLSLIPFVNIDVTVATARKKDRTMLFSLPFGDDGHFSVGGQAGIVIDFYETLEIGFGGGGRQFFAHKFENFRLPTNDNQTGIYPFSTDVKRQPGRNFFFDAHINAYHFLDLITVWAQYQMACHQEDKITLLNEADKGVFVPETFECTTKWESHVINTAITYDISPNIVLGFMVQWPVKQKNAYRSTTLLGTFQVSF